MMNLAQEEKDKFIVWLRQEADDFDLLIEQMKKINVADNVIKVQTQRSIAYRLVAYDLERTETMTLGGVSSVE